jgi:type IV pilus assembly protein PilN
MPRINLLPIKAAKRNKSVRQELIVVVILCVGVMGGLKMWNDSVSQQIRTTRTKVSKIKGDIKSLSKEAQRVEELESKAKVLEDKLAVIEKLKRQKVGPAVLMHDLATILTELDKVWLTSIREADGELVFEGGAMDHEDISEFQMGLEKRSKFFRNLRLGIVETQQLDGVRYLKWSITCIADFSAG